MGFSGGIDGFDYTTGPRKDWRLNLYNKNDYDFTDIHNVYGVLEGQEKDKVILIGNHRDAWIKGGAADPNSGSAIMLEIARALNELTKEGFKPHYSIVLASWDGEEYGLLGSTAYAEKYGERLGKEVVTYINLDAAVSGSHLKMAASPLLNEFLLSVAKKVVYPKAVNTTLLEHFASESKIHILGSGSDYTAFYEHLGIPSVDLGFGVGKDDAVYHYHSNYDSLYWMKNIADPGFQLHNTLAQYVGLLVLNISERKLVTYYQARQYSYSISEYFNKLADDLPKDWLGKKVSLDDTSFNGLRESHHGKHKNETLYALVDDMRRLLKHHYKVCFKYDSYLENLQKLWDKEISHSNNPFRKYFFNKKVNSANAKIMHLEKKFLYEDGLNGREWFKHIVFASGRHTGYAGQALPGLAEAIEDEDFDEAVRWMRIIKRKLFSSLIDLDF